MYPKVSHAFIRREILALEALGTPVRRYSIRRSPEALVDPADVAEAEKTQVLLEGKGRLVWDAVRWMLVRPGDLVRGLAMAWRLAPGGMGALVKQLIYLVEAAGLAARCRRDGVTHLHAHFGTNPAAVALLCQVVGGPTYSFTVHGPDEFDAPAALRLGLKVRYAKFAVAISQYGRSQLCRWAELADWEKIHVVRCGVDASFLEGELTPPPTEPRFVCVARLSEQKGLPVLVEAMALLKQRGVEATVELIGDGPLRGMLERLVRERGLEGRVVFRGNQPSSEVRRAIVGARALVLPSFAEGLPVVLMEALALGRPAIATQIAGIPELIRPGETGWLVPPGDAEALAGAMREALSGTLCGLEGAVKRRGAVRERHDVLKEAGRLRDLLTSAERFDA
ncbi:MAG: glycosyltransferase [Tepidisphaerales bacterium]